ncbi:YqaA family protein [Psittacicella hinzii]|nr:YqaA family protein [Psittacicella hinzii]
MIKKLYDRTMYYAGHKNANTFLCIYSFLEAIILPIPIDVLVGPIAMQKPKQAFRLAFYAAFFSLLGGCVGYALGMFFEDVAAHIFALITNEPVTAQTIHESATFAKIEEFLDKHGILSIILVGFTPLPFKIFTIVFGFFHYNFLVFIGLSFISRLVRFLIVTYLFAYFGQKYRQQIENIINKSGWIILIVAIVGFLLYYTLK